MSPYWMPRPEQGDGARPTSHIFFMHIENMVMSAFALLHGNDAFPSAVRRVGKVGVDPREPDSGHRALWP